MIILYWINPIQRASGLNQWCHRKSQ